MESQSGGLTETERQMQSYIEDQPRPKLVAVVVIIVDVPFTYHVGEVCIIA